ncbi:MAG: GTP-binding protein [Candidatus Saccharibacteria bacterium]|nr:GTP-binding protein [Candidatus Saccharibacteria bacterium]
MNKTKLYIVNGALGAGKTTVVDVLLRQASFRGARVIENEFASTSVDTGVLAQRASAVATITGACVCCHDGDELVEQLHMFAERGGQPVIIESTGVANTVRLLEKLAASDVLERYTIMQSLYVVDGLEMSGKPIPEVMRAEIAVADMVLLTKGDMLRRHEQADIEAAVRQCGATAVVWADHGAFDVDLMAQPSRAVVRALDYDVAPGGTAMSYTVIATTDWCISPTTLRDIWRKLQEKHRVYRMKGEFSDGVMQYHVEATPRQCVIQKAETMAGALVLIGEGAHAITRAMIKEMII